MYYSNFPYPYFAGVTGIDGKMRHMKPEDFSYPSYSEPLLDAYARRFESVFIILHPFIKLPTEMANNNDLPFEQMVAHAQPCPWAYVAKETGLGSLAKVNHALLTLYGSLKEEFCDLSASETLESFLKRESFWEPRNGGFDALISSEFSEIFRSSGTDEVIYVPELDPAQRLKVSDLKHSIAPGLVWFAGTLLHPGYELLFTVDWDSFFTLFYGSDVFLHEVVQKHSLEGFFVNPSHRHYWYRETIP